MGIPREQVLVCYVHGQDTAQSISWLAYVALDIKENQNIILRKNETKNYFIQTWTKDLNTPYFVQRLLKRLVTTN